MKSIACAAPSDSIVGSSLLRDRSNNDGGRQRDWAEYPLCPECEGATVRSRRLIPGAGLPQSLGAHVRAHQGSGLWHGGLVARGCTGKLPNCTSYRVNTDSVFQVFMFLKAGVIIVSKLTFESRMLLPMLTTTVAENGLGLHTENLQPSNFVTILKMLYASTIEYWCVRKMLL